MRKFKDWLSSIILEDLYEERIPLSIIPFFIEAELPWPGPGWGYGWSDYLQMNAFMKRGERVRPAFTPDDPNLKKRGAPHSQDPRQFKQKKQSEPTSQPNQPQSQSIPKEDKSQEWVYAQSVVDNEHFKKDLDLAMMLLPTGSWFFKILSQGELKDKTGILSTQDIKNKIIRSYRDNNDNPIKSKTPSLEDLKNKLASLSKDNNNLSGVKKIKKIETKKTEIKEGSSGSYKVKTEEEIKLIAEERLKVGSDPKMRKYQIKQNDISEYQQKAKDSFLQTDKNIVIGALAGTGKTTLLKDFSSYARPGEKWVYLVFNKRNEVEGRNKFPPHMKHTDILKGGVYTTHSFLGPLLKDAGIKARLPGDKDKNIDKMKLVMRGQWVGRLADSLGVPQDRKVRGKLVFRANNLANLIKSYNGNIEGDQSELQKLMLNIIKRHKIITTFEINKNKKRNQDRYNRKYGYVASPDETDDEGTEERDFTKEIMEIAKEACRQCLPGQSSESYLNTFRGHDDTLWYAAMYADKINWPRYDVVLADEVQDFNKCQQVVLDYLHRAGARIVAVGDSNQSLYFFRGADSNSFENIEKLLNNKVNGASVESLPINYRCSEQGVAYSNSHTKVPNLICGRRQTEKGPDGKDLKDENGNKIYAVEKDASGNPIIDPATGKPKYKLHQGVINENVNYQRYMNEMFGEYAKNGKKLTKQTAFIARNNKPLIHIALKLLSHGIDFQIVGKDMYNSLLKEIKNIAKVNKNHQVNNMDLDEFYYKADSWLEYLADGRSEEELKGDQDYKASEEMIESLQGIIDFLRDNKWSHPKRPNEKIRDVESLMSYLKLQFDGLNIDNNLSDLEKYEKQKFGMVTLCTGHRSKGLEFQRVNIIRPDQWKLKEEIDGDEDLQQEWNNWYVTLTRHEDEMNIFEEKVP